MSYPLPSGASMSKKRSGSKTRDHRGPAKDLVEDRVYSSIGNLPRSPREKPGYFEPFDVGTIKLRALVKPRTPGQSSFFKNVRGQSPINLCTGPAGTGKTFLSVAAAMLAIVEGKVDRVIVTRPAVESDEELGFLPGGIDSKMMPYMMPIIDCMVDLVGGKTTDLMFEKGVVSVRPFAFMRGSTFSRCFIIADEMQNSTPSQFKNLLTRIGQESKMVVSGDPTQSDLKERNGLVDFMSRFKDFYGADAISRSGHFTVDTLGSQDIVRHTAVEEIISIYEAQKVEILRSA